MPAGGREDALLLGPLSRFFTLSLIAFSLVCSFIHSFKYLLCQERQKQGWNTVPTLS